ncbi:MAG: peptide deformylase [Clostridia bacterium]|nr:peptide deformylase [Clostridia bacterium]
MAIRNVVKIGDDVLRKKCRPVEVFDAKLHLLLDDMYETMQAADGVGLAAPQVGILRRVFIIETEDTGLVECINPEILETLGKQTGEEGCLSVPGKSGVVERPAIVKFKAYNRNGEPFEMVVKKLAARAICHENDHLDGTLYVDKMTEEIIHE